ncbi:MAG TPA: hypothetical protein PLD88_10585, partial [Candidatus Berkiella sp.]|nr:hypothetical protein [Candidatus Berkiella sp.]
ISFARNKLQSLWQWTKNGYQASKNWFANEEYPSAIQQQDQLQNSHNNDNDIQTSHPSLLQRATNLFDLINGQVDEQSENSHKEEKGQPNNQVFDLINGQVDEQSENSHK